MEKLTIYYGIQGNGMRFNFMVQPYKSIKTLFPNAQPAKGLFVEYDMRSNFADYHPQLERHVFPALVGVVTKEDLAQFKRVEFVKTPELTVTYTIEQNEILT